jgi:hypothetical protein
MEESLREVGPKHFEVEICSPVPRFKEDWILESQLSSNVNIKHKSKHAGPTCPQGIVEHGKPVWEEHLTGEAVLKDKVQLAEDEDDIFVEVVADKLADPSIGIAAMNLCKYL